MQRRSDTAGLQDTQSAVRSPQYSIAHRSSFIVPVALFLLAGTIGLLVVPAEGRGAALREWRWLIVEPLIFVGLVWWLSRPETGDGRPETERPETGDRRPETSPEQLLKSLLQTPSNVASSQLVTRNSARPEPVEGSLVTRILAFWLAGGAFVGLVGVLQFLGLNLAPLIGDKVGFSDDQIITQGVQRVTSVYGHPNNLGLYLGRVWPVAAALLIYELRVTSYDLKLRGLRGGTKQLLSTRMLLLTMCALLSIGGLLFSFSRGALLGALAAGAVLLVLHPSLNLARRFGFGARRGWLLLAIGGGALGLAVLLGLAAAALGIERLNPLGESGNIRLLTWQSALAMLRDHPFTGIGLDQFARLYPQYIDPSLAGTNEINTAHPHNLLLDIPLRMGPLGLLAFGWLLVLFFRQVQRADRGSQQTGDGRPGTGDRSSVAPQDVAALRRAALLAGLAAAMTAALVHGMVDSFYFWPDLAFTFWLLLLLAVWGGED